MISNILLIGFGISKQSLTIISIAYSAILIATLAKIFAGNDTLVSKLLKLLLAIFIPVIGIISVWLIGLKNNRFKSQDNW